MHRILLVSVAVALMLVTACSKAPPSPDTDTNGIRVTDCAGREVALPRPAQRIVLLRGRDLFNLSLVLGDGVMDRVIAIGEDIETADQDFYQLFKAIFPGITTLPRVGSIYKDAVNVEHLLELNPDLIIIETFAIDRGYHFVQALERSGLPVLYLTFSDDPFHDPQRSFRILGKVLDAEERTDRLVSFLNTQVDPVLDRVKELREHAPSVYVEAGHQGPEDYGPTYGFHENRRLTSWGNIVHALGGRNIAEGVVSGMAPIRKEYLFEADPDLILLTGAHWPDSVGSLRLGAVTDENTAQGYLRGFCERPGWGTLRAVQTGSVHGIYHGFCLHAIAFGALQQCAKWFYPDEFRDLDPSENLRIFFETFSPLEFQGTWFTTMKKEQ